jgi:hypothetical protein
MEIISWDRNKIVLETLNNCPSMAVISQKEGAGKKTWGMYCQHLPLVAKGR